MRSKLLISGKIFPLVVFAYLPQQLRGACQRDNHQFVRDRDSEFNAGFLSETGLGGGSWGSPMC